MSHTNVDVVKVKRIVEDSIRFKFDGGILVNILSYDDDSFYVFRVDIADVKVIKPIRLEYSIINLKTDKFYKTTLVDPDDYK